MGVSLHRLGPGRNCRMPFWHGCSGERTLLGHEPNYGLGMVLWSYALETRATLWFGHGCSGERRLLGHEPNYGLGMDALVIVCSRNTMRWRYGRAPGAWVPRGE